jgi:hypothetical protein
MAGSGVTGEGLRVAAVPRVRETLRLIAADAARVAEAGPSMYFSDGSTTEPGAGASEVVLVIGDSTSACEPLKLDRRDGVCRGGFIGCALALDMAGLCGYTGVGVTARPRADGVAVALLDDWTPEPGGR